MAFIIQYPNDHEPILIIGLNGDVPIAIQPDDLSRIANEDYETGSQLISNIIPADRDILFVIHNDTCYTYNGSWVSDLGNGGYIITHNDQVVFEAQPRIPSTKRTRRWRHVVLGGLLIALVLVIVLIIIFLIQERKHPAIYYYVSETGVVSDHNNVPLSGSLVAEEADTTGNAEPSMDGNDVYKDTVLSEGTITETESSNELSVKNEMTEQAENGTKEHDINDVKGQDEPGYFRRLEKENSERSKQRKDSENRSSNSKAQSERNIYDSLREGGLRSLRDKKYSDALRQLERAKGIFNTTEINQDIARVNDSIDVAFSRAKELYNTTGDASKQMAIVMFSELTDVRPQSYSYIGLCYSIIGNTTLARDYFEKGVEHDDVLSAYWYAFLLRQTDMNNTTSKRIELYKKATGCVGVEDSLGVEYERLNEIGPAYYWFSQSSSDFSKYRRSCLLLDPDKKNKLGNITDDPYKLLEEAADSDYAPAAYYLGMLHRRNSKSKQDSVNELGWKWIERAANLGHAKAKQELLDKSKYKK